MHTMFMHESPERSLSYSWPGALLKGPLLVIVRNGEHRHWKVTWAATVDEAEKKALEAEAWARQFRRWPQWIIPPQQARCR
jgi:hypothetical protein